MNLRKQKTQIAIVGLGAAGSVLFGELAEAGFDVVGLDAGPHWNPDNDFVSDEREMEKLKWKYARISEGLNPLDLGGGTSGMGVGGGTVHYTMMSLRLHKSDFNTFSRDGVGVDWPIDYDVLEPYYTKVEDSLPVSGPENFLWEGRNTPYKMKQHKLSCIDEVFSIGATRLGLKTSACPLALITEPMTGRQPCINRGFCEQGCKSKAKSTTLHNYIPRGIESGAKIIDNAFVYKINTSKDERTVTSIEYYKEGKKHELECEILIISAFTIETPRLLLMNKSDRHPNGLANSSNMVGKNLMCHTDHEIFAKFERPLRLYRNPPITSINQDFYETNNERDFKRGFSIAPYSARPISFAKTAISCRKDLWGDRLIDFMKNYNFYMQLGMIGEVLPYETNKVELSNEKDKFGLPIPKATFNLEQNEKKMIKFALEKMEEIAKSAGAIKTFRAPLLVHLLGTTRMGEDPATSVIDRDLKAHDLDNLYISGGSVFPTGGAVNPTLTIQALSARLADNFIAKYK